MLPESAAVNRNGADSRYTPSANWTTMSPDIPPTIDRTAACAPDKEQASLLEQLLPLPDGDAYNVVVAAEAGGAKAATTATVAAAAVASATPATIGLRRA